MRLFVYYVKKGKRKNLVCCQSPDKCGWLSNQKSTISQFFCECFKFNICLQSSFQSTDAKVAKRNGFISIQHICVTEITRILSVTFWLLLIPNENFTREIELHIENKKLVPKKAFKGSMMKIIMQMFILLMRNNKPFERY